jgi:two-component system sensor histidine kinase RstB
VTGPAPHRSSSGTWRSGRGELRQIAQFRSFQQRQGARFLASLVLSAIIILLAALLVVWPLIRKLRLQEQTIHAIAEGDLDAHAPEGGDALGKLGTRLNQMTRRIKELLADQRQLIHAVSHEMRTPTARLGFGLEMLADTQSEEELKKRIAAMHDDLSEMDGLLEELLSYLRFDQGEEEFSKEQLGLHEMLEVLRAKVEPFGPEIEIHTRSIPPGARVTANEHHFSRAVENLMRNAIRHANSKVIIRFATSGSTTSLHIDDDGSGIPVGDRLRIFDAIYPPRFVARSQDRRDGIGPRHLAPYL